MRRSPSESCASSTVCSLCRPRWISWISWISDPRRVTVGMQDTFRLRTEEPDVASMRRLDQTMDDILNSHDSPADVMTKYHQALTKYLFDRKVGQHKTIQRTSPPAEPVIRKTPVELPVESPVKQPVKLPVESPAKSPVESSTYRSQSAEPSPRHRTQSRRSRPGRPKLMDLRKWEIR